MKQLTYKPAAGEHISRACLEAVLLADKRKKAVKLVFNGTPVICTWGASWRYSPQERAKRLEAAWVRLSRERHEAWLKSLKGRKARKALAEQATVKARYTAGRALFAAEGILPITLKDAAAWERSVVVNEDDPLSHGITLYTSRWAHLMEAAMARGETLAGCARRTSHEADLIGLSGAAFWCAVNILSQVWAHGDDLRDALKKCSP
jgi:hypothetical protein